MHTQMVRISNSLAYHNALAAKHKEVIGLMLDRRIAVALAPIPATPYVAQPVRPLFNSDSVAQDRSSRFHFHSCLDFSQPPS